MKEMMTQLTQEEAKALVLLLEEFAQCPSEYSEYQPHECDYVEQVQDWKKRMWYCLRGKLVINCIE